MIVKKLFHKCTCISTSGILSTSLCSLKRTIYTEHQNNGTLEQKNEARMQRIQVTPLGLLFSSDRYAIRELRSIADSHQQSFKISTQLLRHLTISVGKQKWVWQHSY